MYHCKSRVPFKLSLWLYDTAMCNACESWWHIRFCFRGNSQSPFSLFYCVFLLCCDFTFLQGHKDYDKFTNCDFPGTGHAIKQLQKYHKHRQLNLILTYCGWFNIIPQTLQVVLFIHKTEHIYTLMRISQKYIFVFMIHTQETISYISSERLISNVLGEQ